MVRALKVMGQGLQGGCSFMEDYTYHLDGSGQKVLGAHMLEVCPSIADGKPKLEVHCLYAMAVKKRPTEDTENTEERGFKLTTPLPKPRQQCRIQCSVSMNHGM